VEGREGEQRIQASPPFALWPSRRSAMYKEARTVRAQQFELMQAIFRSSLWIQVLAFSHPFLRLPIHPAGSDRRDPHALPVCVWGLPKNPVRSFQLSCIVTLRPVELSRKTSPQSTKPRDEFDASRQRRDPSERSDPRNLWSRRRNGRAKAYRRPARVVDCNLRRCVQGRRRRSAAGTARGCPRADGRAAGELRVCSVSSPSRRYISDD
jgi:hypothetical protein